ncbi:MULTISPECIES: conjugal transfer protein TraH [Sphingomonadaceae]|uniref:conjugal transfer protein TraH n=2 Tax=Bacteria TaxID=2 RepID=UPI000AE5350C|nr:MULTISPECIES: conjugal transfer protein TraH [Sphingomonadaceae]MBX9663565.1 conjugal transfer protein TraH [Novosphingobium sp.]
MAHKPMKALGSRLLAPILRRSGIALSALAVASMAGGPVHANVGSELNSFFNDMGAAANATGPVAYQGQSAGYYSGGNIWTRFPQRSVNPVNLQLPSVKAGCGGIDVFSGSFSFINSDEIVAMLKATANNALGFAFQLAIKSISPQISATIEEMAQKAQQMNQFNMNSCETAQNLVGGLSGKSDRMSSEICKSIGNSQGLFSDWAKGRHECGTGGQREATLKANKDPAIPAASYNFTWEMLKQSYPSFSVNFREYLMTFVGTVIFYQDGDASGKRGYQFVGQGDRALLTALLDGGGSVTMLKCDTSDQCLNPTTQSMSVSASQALKPRVRAMIESMNGKVRSNAALTPDEIGLLGATTIPLYKIISVNAAATLGGMTANDMNDLAEIVAMDLLDALAQQYYGYASRGVGSFQNANEEALTQWRAQIVSVRQVLDTYSQGMNLRLERTQHVVQRAVFLEGTLRNNLSPQMSAALRFSTSLSNQGLQ